MPDKSNSRAWQVEALLTKARVATPLQSEVGQCFISVPLKTEAQQIIPLHSPAFQNWLVEQFYSEYQVVPRGSAVRDVIRLLEASTQFGSTPRVPIARRISSSPGRVVLDLYNDEGQLIEITEQGWHVTHNLNAHFRSTRSARPLPYPEKAGSAWDQLRALLDLTPEHFSHCLSWLSAAVSPTGPYPILVIQGAGKSSVAKLLRSLIDPGPTAFCPNPVSSRDLQSLASHNWIVALDEIEQLPSRMLKQLVRLSTGVTFASRDRTSEPEPFHVFLERPILFTSSAALAPELAAAAMTINAPVEVIADAHLRAQILGALCDAISAALPNGRPQLVDNSIAKAVGAFMATRIEWRGSASELLDRLRSGHPSIEWPLSAKGLSQLLRKTVLGGISFQAKQEADGQRFIHLAIKTTVLAKDAQSPALPVTLKQSRAPKAAPSSVIDTHSASDRPADQTAAPKFHRSSPRSG